MWMKNRADSSAFNNLFAEFWLRHVEEGVPSYNVTRIQLAILLKNQLLSMYFFRFLTTSAKISFSRISQWLLSMEEFMK